MAERKKEAEAPKEEEKKMEGPDPYVVSSRAEDSTQAKAQARHRVKAPLTAKEAKREKNAKDAFEEVKKMLDEQYGTKSTKYVREEKAKTTGLTRE